MHPIRHFKTITAHRHLVCWYCFRLGLIGQGLVHDLSKYSPEEFLRGAKYFQGFRSPNDEERAQTGLSLAWLHHKGRNRHHFEYWIDWVVEPGGTVKYAGNKMPLKYIAEMFCDRIAASKVYLGERYTDASPYEYYIKGKPNAATMHAETMAELEEMLLTLKEKGEDAAFQYVRERLRKEKKNRMRKHLNAETDSKTGEEEQ